MTQSAAEHAGRGWIKFRSAMAAAIAQFGAMVKDKLDAPDAEQEEQLRAPLEVLLQRAGEALGIKVVAHGETRLAHLHARPDFAIDAARARVGYIELKAPGKGIPLTSSWHPRVQDTSQWEKLKGLPNLIYGDGRNWALYHFGRIEGTVAIFVGGDIKRAGERLHTNDDAFAKMLYEFLLWRPERPRTLDKLVNAVANLCTVLYAEVCEILAFERASAGSTKLFEPLAEDWRRLLYPDLRDEEFADAYAQTVTFALLLARVDGISFADRTTVEIAAQLRKRHPLMGRALEVLTNHTAERGGVIETLTRIIGAVNWDDYASENRDPYALLYEKFLEIYDPDLRKRTGTYYTPIDVVQFMVRFVGQVIRSRLEYPLGLADENVIVVDPAMGTGTYLAEIIKAAAEIISSEEGPGAVPPRLRDMCNRLIGFEVQAGPYAIAELRIYSELKQNNADPPEHMRLCVADTLDSPYREEELGLGHIYQEIERSRRDANNVKRNVPVLVVIGNPPYGARAEASGKWILERSGAMRSALIDDFRPSQPKLGYCIHDKYIYFMRWAIWKVFEAHPECPAGIVAFICPSSFINGPGFSRMREYLRRLTDEGWIIDLSPDGHQANIPYRIFPDNQNPVCISIFVRSGPPKPSEPARMHHVTVPGRRDDKFAMLAEIEPDDVRFGACSTSWLAPLRPPMSGQWSRHPALADLLTWAEPGVTPGRTWVYAPHPDLLLSRLVAFLGAPREEQAALFGPKPKSIPLDKYQSRVATVVTSLAADKNPPRIEQVAYRSFDRQYLLADERLVDRIRLSLWRIDGGRQVFITEQHTTQIKSGPGLLFSSVVPDKHQFMGSFGGRVFPIYRDLDLRIPNCHPRLLQYLGSVYRAAISIEDLAAYMAAIVGSANYADYFERELTDFPGVRVPITSDADLWREAVAIGETVIWLHTFGNRYIDADAGRPKICPRMPQKRRPLVVSPGIPDTEDGMPDRILYDAGTETLLIGSGAIHPVPRGIWDYSVSGTRVLSRWFASRSKTLRHARRSSRLNDLRDRTWRPSTTTDLLEVVNVLGLLDQIERSQFDLFERVVSGEFITVDELRRAGVIPVMASRGRVNGSDAGPTLFSDSL